MKRVYNFSAGPAALPTSVLEKAQKELLDYRNSGMSLMEMSHRGKEFTEIIESATALLKELMQVPDHYKILFVPGGASVQFAMIPMNFAPNRIADFVDTGVWSEKAIREAERMMEVNIVASGRNAGYCSIPELNATTFNPAADYVHITTNNTIYGTRYQKLPDTGHVPLIADMSSDILSRPYDVSQFGMIYAGAQKNIGPSGLAVCIIREDLLGRCPEHLPNIFNYRVLAAHNSVYNTPPTFGIYLCKLVLEWLKEQGGVHEIEKINEAKAGLLYAFLDHSRLFRATVQAPYRSIMNIPFGTGSEEIDNRFISEATAAGLAQLKGHRTVGGMRASIYNAMPLSGVQALVDFMKKFELENA